MPPIYSALKVDGVRAYRRARDGEEFDLKARAVQVYSLDLVRLEGERVWLRVHCGRGTYIRSLARDLGVALGTVAHLGALRRTSVGPYRVEDAVVLGEDQVLTRDSLRARMLPLRQSFGSAPAVRITEDYLGALRYGRSPLPSQLLDPPPSEPGTRFLLVDQSMEPLAVAEPDPVTGGGRLRRVLQRASTRLHTS